MTLKQARSIIQDMIAKAPPDGIGRVSGETQTDKAQLWHQALRFYLDATATMSEADAIANIRAKGNL